MMRQTLQPSLIAGGSGRTILIAGGERGVIYNPYGYGTQGLSGEVQRKAQQYGVWKEVRQWAKEHPLAVKWLNQDTDMIHSIAETGWTRSVNNGGSTYVNTGIRPSSGVTRMEHKIKFNVLNVRQLMGANSNGGYWGVNTSGNYERYTNSGVRAGGYDVFVLDNNLSHATVNGVDTNLSGGIGWSGTQEYQLLALGGSYKCNARIVWFKALLADGTVYTYYLPYRSPETGQMELLDIVTGTLATRVGTFTESIEDNQ